MNLNWADGVGGREPVSLQQMDHCVASRGEWVLRVLLVPAVACSLFHTSPLCLRSALFHPPPLPHPVVLSLSAGLAFVNFFFHTKLIHCRFPSETLCFFKQGGTVFFSPPTSCFVLYSYFEEEEQVGKLLVTGEEC